jgi:hypothetical protein
LSAKNKRPSRSLVVSAKGTAPSGLLGDVRSLIEAARFRTAQAVNAELVQLYWQFGKRIREELLNEERAPYGEQIAITGETIERRVRTRLHGQQPVSHDSICRGISG